ncbi:TRAP transporter substrate-binding protein DctP [uncultured Desulfobacter sp.]|uniref:TRAP transporter substrate-binding protein n=1 Tax=uncultured Desulfobacter sp. TaxID=240139 RepID=UPI002AABFC5E|nr:TRAP transporter substrate-binding protein DctP [uncultured Desulfobacter sp.]
MFNKPVLKLFSFMLILTFFCGTARAVILKIATISPEGSMWMEKMREGADQVANATDRRVTFKFYPGGVMGNDKAVLRKIRINQLQGGAIMAGSLSSFFPGNQIYAQPLKFKSQEEVDYVRSHMDEYIIKGLDDAGFVCFTLMGGGFAYIMSKSAISSVEDLRSRKIWVPDNDKMSVDSVGSFGVSPIALPLADVRTGLQSGLIDTVGTSPVGAIVLQWHTEIKYITNLPLIYLYAVFAIDKDTFHKISPEDQKVVYEIMNRELKEVDRLNREDNEKAIDALKKQGIEFITPSQEQMGEWLAAAAKASRKMIVEQDLPKEPADKVNALLEQYRKNQ